MVICLKMAVSHENAQQKNHINSKTIHAVVQLCPYTSEACRTHSPTSVSGCAWWLSVVSSSNLHFSVCGKKPHQSISPLRCGPLMEQSQVPLQETTSGIHYYFQIFPDFIQLNSAETPVLLFTQKNISNQYQIRNTIILLQTLWESVFHCLAPAWIFPDF